MSAGILNPGVLISDEELPAASQPIEDSGLPSGQENAAPPYCGVIDTVPVEAGHA